MADFEIDEPPSRRAARAALRALLVARARLSPPSPQRNDRGQLLDPETSVLLRVLNRMQPPEGVPRSVGVARYEYDHLGPILDVPPARMHRIEDRVIRAPVTARVYRPRAARPSPACVYFHGGGFVLGSPRSHDGLVRRLAADTGAVFVSVDYRLAPEHKLPAAHGDALFAFEWTRAHAADLGIDPTRIVLAGDSAGGNLALSTALSLRDAQAPAPRGLLLIYPAVDMTRSFPSHRELADGFFLTRKLLDWFMERFLRSPEQIRDPRLSPLAATSFARLPPTHVVTAGFDPLRDEAEALVTLLAEAGIEVTHRSEDSLVHGFVSMGGVLREAERALERIGKAMSRLVERPQSS